MKRKLPIGIQTFREIREEGHYYVDKTMYARRLAEGGKHYFLSRPRRFGKSLFLDTLKELFEGAEPLFRGLDVHEHWDWSVRRPVLRISFGGRTFAEPGHLETNLAAQLGAAERRAGIEALHADAPERFTHLIETLHENAGRRVVVLVDEYDKPILDALGNPELARANRDFLRGFYGVVKDCDAHVEFTFLTGVSKFSKVSLFSGLNNLVDITLEPECSAVCGGQRPGHGFRVGTSGPRPGRDPPLTATTGAARRRFTTRSTSCCFSGGASSDRTGSRPARRPSWSRRCCGAAWRHPTSTA